jgi:hypothetical protein
LKLGLRPRNSFSVVYVLGVRCIWNDGKQGGKMPNGHYEFVNSTMGSRSIIFSEKLYKFL